MRLRSTHRWMGISVFGAMAVTACAVQTGIGGPAEYSASLHGNFVAGGNSSRVLGGPPQNNPFNVNIGGIPVGSQIVKAFANWSYLSNFDSNAIDGTIRLNGTVVNGIRSGFGDPDLCWGRNYGVSYSQDVTSIVQAAGGNGVYSVQDATDHLATASLGEGFSLIVVYENANEIKRQVDIDFGYTSTTSGDGNGELRFDQGAYQGGPTKMFINGLDGQDGYSDDFYLNGTLAGAFLPEFTIGDAWRGLAGPGAPGTNYFDYNEFDASPFMSVGDSSISFRTVGAGNGDALGYQDCVGHTVVAISMPVPEPGAWMGLGLGMLAFASARNRRKA